MNRKLLTVPEAEKDYRPLLLTGNHYLSLAEIDPREGGIISANLLLMQARGLLEFAGSEPEPLIQPFLQVKGSDVSLNGKLKWRYCLNWIPAFSAQGDNWLLEGEIFAPPGHRGALYRLTLTNNGPEPLQACLGWQGCWHHVYHTVFNRRLITGSHQLYYNAWTDSLVLEAAAGLPLAALSLAAEPRVDWHLPKAAPFRFTGSRQKELQPGESLSLTLYLGCNLEADGAATTTVDLRRRGWEQLRQETVTWLSRHQVAAGDGNLSGIINRNAFFNYFYALGRALEDDTLVPVTSRSPRYYVSAAFWSRDALLWSLPGLLLLDQPICRELIVNIFTRHLSNAGDHAHYINGSLLYPGFELDQLCAHFIALEAYLNSTKDSSILQEAAVTAGLSLLLHKLLAQKDPVTGLYQTCLDPSDDPVTYPFLTYDNVLAWRSLAFLGRLQGTGVPDSEFDFYREAERLKKALASLAVTEGPFGPMYAWSVDGAGGYELYDNPPGSLQLLPHYGFCPCDDPIFQNTLSWIYSHHNPYYNEESCPWGYGSRHAGSPWPLSAASALLAGKHEAVQFFSWAGMDNGFACETVNPTDGKAATGLAFATCAGFVAAALQKEQRQSADITPSES